MNTCKYDVFVSYSHLDGDWVRTQLVTRLELHGFKVAVDYRDFRGGAPSVEEMERCVIESKRVIIVLSPAYVESEWSKFENIMAQTLDPSAAQRKIVPLLLRHCEIPLRLRILNYRDLTAGSPDQWDRLVRDLI